MSSCYLTNILEGGFMKHIKLIQAVVATSLVCAGMTATAATVFASKDHHVQSTILVGSTTLAPFTWVNTDATNSLSVTLPNTFKPSNPAISLPAPTAGAKNTVYAVYFDRACSNNAALEVGEQLMAYYAIKSSSYKTPIYSTATCATTPIASGPGSIFVTVQSLSEGVSSSK